MIYCFMVFICSEPFTENEQYQQYFDYFQGFELSDFQKWAVKSIVTNNHVLITAHTGSGKTLPAEFIIQYYANMPDYHKRRKIIYASPIKALSNQKLYDMRRKFPHISFGLLTGDCKDNPEADVLIMTTEILRNTLFNKQINKQMKENDKSEVPLSFDLDIENELAGVVFDEVHYINDVERGSVWEQSLLLLPPQVQLVLLSATIDKPEEFAKWIETSKNSQNRELKLPEKTMYLASTNHRVVPLKHYMWISCHNWLLKDKADQMKQSALSGLVNRPIPILGNDKRFDEKKYYEVYNSIKYTQLKRDYMKREFILNGLVRYLKKNNMLPAICFIFSRKNVEMAAKEINFSLFDNETEGHMATNVHKECRSILASKLVNYREFLELPEYNDLVKLLEKGVAIHHAGMITILREIVELLFEKGFIKMLFATETFAVGLNMPTKTVVFTGLSKFNGSTMRPLFSHEYTQMAGRAGRRGLDTIGHVIHCNNLFEIPDVSDYRKMLTGPPQKLESKFKISYSLGLNMVASGGENETAIREFVDSSLLNSDIQKEVAYYLSETDKVVKEINNKKTQIETCKTPIDAMRDYGELTIKQQNCKQKQAKQIKRQLENLKDNHPNLERDIKLYDSISLLHGSVDANIRQTDAASTMIQRGVNKIVELLVSEDFIENDENKLRLNESGIIASQIQEAHPLVLSKVMIETKYFKDFTARELTSLFSCFICISLPEDTKINEPKTNSELVNNVSSDMKNKLSHFERKELATNIDSGVSYNICFDLQQEMLDWVEADNEDKCKEILERAKQKGVFTGEFIKAILKINNIADEFVKICETINHVELLEKIKEIPNKTLKYIITNQSLYI